MCHLTCSAGERGAPQAAARHSQPERHLRQPLRRLGAGARARSRRSQPSRATDGQRAWAGLGCDPRPAVSAGRAVTPASGFLADQHPSWAPVGLLALLPPIASVISVHLRDRAPRPTMHATPIGRTNVPRCLVYRHLPVDRGVAPSGTAVGQDPGCGRRKPGRGRGVRVAIRQGMDLLVAAVGPDRSAAGIRCRQVDIHDVLVGVIGVHGRTSSLVDRRARCLRGAQRGPPGSQSHRSKSPVGVRGGSRWRRLASTPALASVASVTTVDAD